MKNVIVVGLTALVVSVAPAMARTTKAAVATQGVSDQQFIVNAAKASMVEVALGKVAETKASRDEVKTFARRIVDDQQKVLDGLKTIAQTEKVTLPTTLDPKDQALANRLVKLSGHALDRSYTGAIVRDHRRDVIEFSGASKNAKAADVKQYAANTLPSLEADLKLAQDMDRSIRGRSDVPGSKKPTI